MFRSLSSKYKLVLKCLISASAPVQSRTFIEDEPPQVKTSCSLDECQIMTISDVYLYVDYPRDILCSCAFRGTRDAALLLASVQLSICNTCYNAVSEVVPCVSGSSGHLLNCFH